MVIADYQSCNPLGWLIFSDELTFHALVIDWSYQGGRNIISKWYGKNHLALNVVLAALGAIVLFSLSYYMFRDEHPLKWWALLGALIAALNFAIDFNKIRKNRSEGSLTKSTGHGPDTER